MKVNDIPKKPAICVQICVTHTFDYINSSFFDLMVSLKTRYPYTLIRNNMLPIDRNRTHLVNMGMENAAITHFLFIDTDIVPNRPDFLDHMISYDLPIIGLLCTKKVPPYEPILYKKDAPKEEVFNNFWVKHPKGLVEVDSVGTGCLLVKKEVFRKMNQPYFKFVSAYEKGLYQSEDVYFLQHAKQAGYKVYVDTENSCKHYGPTGFGVEDFNRYMEMAQENTDAK